MNWRLGLRRISAVFWGFWGFVACIISLGAASEFIHQSVIQGVGVAIGGIAISAAVLFGLYRLTCWIIDGFFASK